MKTGFVRIAVLIALAGSAAARADVIYSQNFDSMGPAGTTAPAGWTEYSLSGSHDTFSFAGSLPTIVTTFLPNSSPTAINNGTGTSAVSAHPTLAVQTDPSNQRSSSGYNFGLSSSPTDRCLGTSPTGVAACELELSLANPTPGALSSFSISYDIRRFSTTTNNNASYNSSPWVGVEELPGFQLFYSLDNGTTWTNVEALNPVLTGTGVVVPNSVGVTTIPQTVVNLDAPWAAGATILLRWFDDNAQSPSPDQLIGLDNVVISTVAQPCYANCDGSTFAPILNVNDFTCFLNRFAAGDSYANCDGSTAPPVLNVNDFQCFLNQYARGCP